MARRASASSTEVTPSDVAPAPSEAAAASRAPCPKPSALTTAIRRVARAARNRVLAAIAAGSSVSSGRSPRAIRRGGSATRTPEAIDGAQCMRRLS